MRADRGRDGGDRSIGLDTRVIDIDIDIIVIVIIIPDHGRVDG